MKIVTNWTKYAGVVNALAFASAAALVLFLARSVATGSTKFSFMAWNLVLSLLAIIAAVGVRWAYAKGQIILATVVGFVWFLLLPNTFYMLTDYLHVTDTGDINIMFDIVLIGLFAMNGFVHGLLSLLLIHRLVYRHVKQKILTHVGAAFIILASSFAVDMGRYLRWNSWDVLTQPGAVLFDITNALVHPIAADRSLLVTSVFFVSISGLYGATWQLSKLQWGHNGTIKT